MATISDEFDRLSHRLDESIFASPRVASLEDIKRLIKELAPSSSRDSKINAAVVVDGTAHQVSAVVKDVSKRDMLLHGFELIRAAQKLGAVTTVAAVVVNGKPLKKQVVGNGVAWLDEMLKRWLNADRSGQLIRWDVGGIIYLYDIFIHKLYKHA